MKCIYCDHINENDFENCPNCGSAQKQAFVTPKVEATKSTTMTQKPKIDYKAKAKKVINFLKPKLLAFVKYCRSLNKKTIRNVSITVIVVVISFVGYTFITDMLDDPRLNYIESRYNDQNYHAALKECLYGLVDSPSNEKYNSYYEKTRTILIDEIKRASALDDYQTAYESSNSLKELLYSDDEVITLLNDVAKSYSTHITNEISNDFTNGNYELVSSEVDTALSIDPSNERAISMRTTIDQHFTKLAEDEAEAERIAAEAKAEADALAKAEADAKAEAERLIEESKTDEERAAEAIDKDIAKIENLLVDEKYYDALDSAKSLLSKNPSSAACESIYNKSYDASLSYIKKVIATATWITPFSYVEDFNAILYDDPTYISLLSTARTTFVDILIAAAKVNLAKNSTAYDYSAKLHLESALRIDPNNSEALSLLKTIK